MSSAAMFAFPQDFGMESEKPGEKMGWLVLPCVIQEK